MYNRKYVADDRISGQHDHLTVHRDVYRGRPGLRSEIVVHSPELGYGKQRRASFNAQTQTKTDFVRYDANAAKRQPAQPAPATIDLKFKNIK